MMTTEFNTCKHSICRYLGEQRHATYLSQHLSVTSTTAWG